MAGRGLLLSEPYTLSKTRVCDPNWALLSASLGFPKLVLGEGQIGKEGKIRDHGMLASTPSCVCRKSVRMNEIGKESRDERGKEKS